MTSSIVATEQIRLAVRELGLSGEALSVHSSLRSFGWVDGGAVAVVEALEEELCTVLVPTFSSAFSAPPIPGRVLGQNAYDYDRVAPVPDRGFATESTEIDRDMGVIPAAVLEMPDRTRGNHPLCSFAGIGPLAAELLRGQAPLDVCAPLTLLTEKQGYVVLMGVDLTSLTLIHAAEKLAGRNLFRRWAAANHGIVEVEVGGCSRGFNQLDEVLMPFCRKVKVGKSVWVIYEAAEALFAAAEAIRANPEITRCDRSDCGRCAAAVTGGPLLD